MSEKDITPTILVSPPITMTTPSPPLENTTANPESSSDPPSAKEQASAPTKPPKSPPPTDLLPPPSPQPELTPRAKARFDKSEARRIAKEKRDADRAKAKAERANPTSTATTKETTINPSTETIAESKPESSTTDKPPTKIESSESSSLPSPPLPEPELTPRAKARFEKSEARRIAKEKRDADRAKAKAERAKAKAAMKGLSGAERDAARKQMKEDADKKRQEQALDRQADLAKQQAMEDPKGKPAKMSKEVLAHLANKKREEEIAAAKQAILDEERRLREEEEGKITCAHQENDRYSSRVRIQISKSGTNWGSWHSRYASLGYREIRIYNRYENRVPQVTYKIPSGSVARYLPILKVNGGIVENPDKIGGSLNLDVIRADGLRNAGKVFIFSLDPVVALVHILINLFFSLLFSSFLFLPTQSPIHY